MCGCKLLREAIFAVLLVELIFFLVVCHILYSVGTEFEVAHYSACERVLWHFDVDGAVGMVEMALERLNENNVVELDEERKAQMVSNLLVVLCGNKDATPIVNSGSLY